MGNVSHALTLAKKTVLSCFGAQLELVLSSTTTLNISHIHVWFNKRERKKQQHNETSLNAWQQFRLLQNVLRGCSAAPFIRSSLHLTEHCICITKHIECQNPSLSCRTFIILAVVMLCGCSYTAWGQLALTSFPLRDAGGQSVWPSPASLFNEVSRVWSVVGQCLFLK